MSKTEKLGILTRVSSKPQETDGTSLEVQKKLGLKLSKSLGLEPMIFNEGSQSTYEVELTKRPILLDLLHHIQNNEIKKLYVFNTDRLGRFSDSWFTILKVLVGYKVQLYIGESLKPYDFSNPTDRLTVGILSLVSIYDNELRKMRSVLGKRNSLKSGNTYVGGTKPFGYDVKKKKLIINKEESECVKKMYEMYKEGKSTMDIKTYLDIKTDFKPKRSKSGWNVGTIQKILGNPLYIGTQRWEWKDGTDILETIDIKTPKIVPKKLWNEVQKVLESNLRHRDNKKKNFTLFDGLLCCKSCKTPLFIKNNPKSDHQLYSCRSVEYGWKNPIKWKKRHENCTLKKSVRVEETDKLMINHLIGILKESKRVRENFKLKSLTPKFEDVKNLKIKKNKKEKYLNEKKNYKNSLEDNLVDTEVKLLTKEVSVSVGEKMKEKINTLIKEVDEQIESIERELDVLNKSNEWIDWLNKMYLEIDSLENLPLEKQRKFVSEYLKKINVEYLSDIKSHKFDFEFLYPIVEDEIKLDGVDKDGMRKYEIVDGKRKTSIVNKTTNRRTKNRVDTLRKHITKMRVEEELSLSEMCKRLNQKGIFTPRNKRWDKPKLSSYIKNLKLEVDVGKV